MGTTKNVTVTGLYVRERFTMRIWKALRAFMGHKSVQDWQPMHPCVCCEKQIEVRSAYCARCGVYQFADVAPQVVLPQTEAIQRLPSPTRHTEELTSQMYAVRICELRPLHQYLQEQKRKVVQQERKKAEEALRNEARRRAAAK